MQAQDKKAISDATGVVINSVRAVGGGDDSEVNVLLSVVGKMVFRHFNLLNLFLVLHSTQPSEA